MDPRAARIGRNEALFREVNDRIERVSDALQITDERIGILCECGDPSCTEKIELSRAEYERVRADPSLFFVRPGHEEPGVEDVVEDHGVYGVIRKKVGAPAELAKELDDRRS